MQKLRSILVTGFEPFGGMDRNPSGEAALLLRGASLPGISLHALQLPVSAPAAWQRMRAAIRRHDADIVIALGVAAGSAAIRVECTAWNHADYRIPDNRGLQPRGVPVIRHAPERREVLADASLIRKALRSQGLPAELSSDAGRYVCNDLYYRLLHYAARPASGIRQAVFIHVPEATVIPPQVMADALRMLLAEM